MGGWTQLHGNPAAVMAKASRTVSRGDTMLRSLSLPPGHPPAPLDPGLMGPKAQARAVCR